MDERTGLDCAPPSIQVSMRRRAIEIDGGMGGSASRRNHPASAISVGSGTISPSTQRAKKPIISECGKGHGWEPW